MEDNINHRVEQHKIKSNTPYYKILDEACGKAKVLYNSVNYAQRQAFFTAGRDMKSFKIEWQEVRGEFIQTEVYKGLGGHLSAEVVHQCIGNWKGYKEAWFSWNKEYSKQVEKEGIKYKYTGSGEIKRQKNGEPIIDKETASFKGEPQPPRYIKATHNAIMLDSGSFSIKQEGILILPKRLGNIEIKTQMTNICGVRILPRTNHFIIEIIYKVQAVEELEDNGIYLGVDLGVTNYVAIVSNTGMKPEVVDGGFVKSVNQFWNKRKAHYQEIAERMNGKKQTRMLEIIAYKRNRQVKDYMHKASRYITDLAVRMNACAIYIGKNDGWKQGVNLGKHTNQLFTQIPYAGFIDQLTYKCASVGVKVITIQESHTSKTSFLDGETPYHHDSYVGKRIKRGLFRSFDGTLINADVNGAYQIMRKAGINVEPNVVSTGGS
ncbi:MAG: transposase, partial [Firmicutes bacterium]|nr:transposase [Bacillota bacterium]